MKKLSLLAAAAALTLLVAGAALAAATPRTVIAIPGLHCGGCAKKVTTSLATVPGVAGSTADLKAKTITVNVKAGQAPSPRALWEAVEKAGQVPTKLECPAGTFTAKPQS